MQADSSNLTCAAGTSETWERLWRYRPTAEKDATLLARERRGPRWHNVVDRLQNTFGSIEGLKTIELGCGRGDMSALFAQEGASVTLFDYTEVALNEARWRFERLSLQADYQLGDMLKSLSPWEASFDVSTSLGVVEHFRGEQRTQVIRAHYDVLKPGGLAIISVPHALCLPYRVWKAYLELRGWWPYGMEKPYTKREMIHRARLAGFRRVEVHCLNFWQAVGDQWVKRLTSLEPDWVDKPSVLDRWMGLNLVLFAWK